MEEGGRACDSSSKSRGKGEESVDGCQFATVHEEAPRPTRPFGNCTKGLAVFSLTCWNGTTCQRNMVCNFSCKMRSGRVGPRCHIKFFWKFAALVIDLYFFNIQSEWIAPMVITRERIYRWARWAGGNNLSAKRVDLEKRVDPMLGFVWIFQLWPLDRVNQWLTFKVILIL